MPIYEYKCVECENEFEELLSLEDYSPIRVCPECNAPSTRKLSAPQLQLKVTRQHECNHSSCEHEHEEKQKGVYQQIREGTRPWMLG